ncbi:hypothetical protein COO60DRAFT_972046 [Scenedesmus sp. NREL 46B-D3]|nr:hypothetical protein COO60DRAFT_972046 [Scenedesmus sp. NREL 46B-D3]
MPSQAVLARNQNKRTLSPVISEREAGLKAQCIRGAANRCMGMDRDAANTDAAAQQDALRHLEQQLRQRDETISVLQRRLEHFRVWLLGVQAQVSARDPQIIKNARRLYVGGIPEGTKEEELRAFFEGVMASTGAAVAPGPPIASVKVSSDRSYAFLELRSVEEASNAMAFDGILFNDVNLKACVGSLLLGVTQMYQVRARLMHSANHVTGLLVNPCSSHAGELRRVVSLDSSMHCRRRCSNGVGVGVDALSICPPVEMQALLNFWTLVPSYAAHAIPF